MVLAAGVASSAPLRTRQGGFVVQSGVLTPLRRQPV